MNNIKSSNCPIKIQNIDCHAGNCAEKVFETAVARCLKNVISLEIP